MRTAPIAAGALLACVAASFSAQPVKDAPGQSLGIASAANLRDIGGYATRDGRVVRKKLLYRSSALGTLSADDREKLAALNLKCDYDLRTVQERMAQPDRLPPDVKIIALDVLADSDRSATVQLGKLLLKPKEANAELGDGKAEAIFTKTYREFVSLPSARKAYRQLFLDLGTEAKLPAVFHCTTGKDRTGWATAALLTLLGVSEETVLADYLRSNDYVLPAYQKTIDSFTKAGGDPAIARAILGVKAEYLKAAFDEMKTKYGSIGNYFSKALDIDGAGQAALRERFLGNPN